MISCSSKSKKDYVDDVYMYVTCMIMYSEISFTITNYITLNSLHMLKHWNN